MNLDVQETFLTVSLSSNSSMLTRVSQQTPPPLELTDISLTYSVFSRCEYTGYFCITDLHLLTELVHSEENSVSKRQTVFGENTPSPSK